MRLRSFAARVVLLSALAAPPALHASDKVVVSCPAKSDQKLLSVYVFQMPEGKLVRGSVGVRGSSWDLTTLSLDGGQHLVLDCGYGPLDAAPGTRANPKDVVVKRIPEDAGRCWRSRTPVAGRCYAK